MCSDAKKKRSKKSLLQGESPLGPDFLQVYSGDAHVKTIKMEEREG